MLRSWKRAIEKVNESNEYKIPNCGLHSLRKLFCKNARDGAGLDWINIQRVMGHSDVSITQKVYYIICTYNQGVCYGYHIHTR